MKKMEISELNKYRYIVGGLAAPGKGRGFIVILGRLREGAEAMVVIDEMEVKDLYELVHTAAIWDAFFKCDRWYGDGGNLTMKDFVRQIRKEVAGSQKFGIAPTLLAEKKQGFYEFAMPTIRKLIDEGKLVLPPNGLLRDYLSKIDADDISSMEFGTFPAVEALTFAAVELHRYKSGGNNVTQKAKHDSIKI
ncbi:MAG: hypothetical protein ABIF19_15180 [Planctomycetota bacterium]